MNFDVADLFSIKTVLLKKIVLNFVFSSDLGITEIAILPLKN